MSSDETLYCTMCGAEIKSDNYQTIDGQVVCKNCVEEHYVQCADCGQYVLEDEIVHVANGDRVCDSCLSNDYSYCDECDEYVPNDEIVYLKNYNSYVCQDCLDNMYSICENCNEYVRDDDVCTDDDGDRYCQDCYDELYVSCADCGCEVRRSDAYEHDGDWYCESCYDDLNSDEEDDENGIYSYHGFNHNNYTPRYADGERVTSNTHLYGMELEVAGNTSYAREVVDLLQGNAIAMYDSSVDGFELVFMPMSRKYIYENLKPILEKALDFLASKNFKGHNKGGIHVHFTKLSDSTKVANMTQIMYGDDEDRKLWLKITQRKESAMHWCSMSSCVPSAQEIIRNNIYAPAGYGNHGTALNFCTRTNTHELRIFNSSIRLDRVMKNLECVFALEDYVEKASEPVCNTRGFITFVDENADKYPVLSAFFTEKKVFEIARKFYGDKYEHETKAETVNVEPAMIVTANEVIENIDMPVNNIEFAVR